MIHEYVAKRNTNVLFTNNVDIMKIKRKSLVILPIKDITNVYSSNCFYGSYDYSFKAVAVETVMGETFYFSKCSKQQNVADYNTELDTLAKRCRMNEGSLIA